MACACMALDSGLSSYNTEHRITEKKRFMQNTSAGQSSCSFLSKTVVHLSIPLTQGIQTQCPILAPNSNYVINLISFMCASCHVTAICLCSIPHDTVQRRSREKSFLCAGEKSLREDYASPADDIIKSVWTEKKGRVGVRKMGFKRGIEKAVFE